MFAVASRAAVRGAAPVARRQQRRGIINWMVNYPDKVRYNSSPVSARRNRLGAVGRSRPLALGRRPGSRRPIGRAEKGRRPVALGSRSSFRCGTAGIRRRRRHLLD
ncbi:hypothetical protein ACHAWF_008309 [Thalassiosira exigua]